MAEKYKQSYSEHEQANKVIDSPTVKTSETGDKKEQQDIRLVMGLLEQGKSEKKSIMADWDERYKFYNDEQWPKDRPKSKSSPVINVIKMTIQSMLPILTDTRPGFNVLPEEPNDFNFAELLEKTTQSWWEKRGMDHTLIEVLTDECIYDAGILKVIWNEELMQGIGDIDCKVIDPRNILVPHDARDFDKQCSWVIELMDRSVGELKRKFPDKADIIKADSDENTEGEVKSEGIKIQSPIDKHSNSNTNNKHSTAENDRKMCKVAECWIDDDAVVEFEEEDNEGNKKKKFKKEYPNGKLIIFLVNQKRVLISTANPYKHGGKPYIRFVDMINPRKFWGDGEVRQLMGIQKAINKTMANIIDTMNLMSNHIWLNEKDSGVDSNKIRNGIGMVLEPNAGKSGAISRLSAPPVPEYILNLYNQLMQVAEKISGSSEITQGRRPKGVTAAAAIETIQEAANTRIRLKERNMQVSLSQLGSMVIQLMMQYYTTPRVTRLTGKDGWPEYFEFFVDNADEDRIQSNTQRYTYNEEKNGYDKIGDFEVGSPSKGIFDVQVIAGTALPHEKAQRVNIAFKLFEQQVIDAEELLTRLEYPDKEKILKRMEEKKQAELQQAMAMQAQQGQV